MYFPTFQFDSKVPQHCSCDTVVWSRPSTIASNRLLQLAQCESTSFKTTVLTKIAPVLALSATPPLTIVTQVVQKIHWKKHWTSRLTQPGLSCRMDPAKSELNIHRPQALAPAFNQHFKVLSAKGDQRNQSLRCQLAYMANLQKSLLAEMHRKVVEQATAICAALTCTDTLVIG